MSSLDSFFPTTEEELAKILSKSPAKTCELDPVPTDLLKDSLDVLLPMLDVHSEQIS